MHTILVGSYSDEITTLKFDPDAGTLRVVSTVKSGQSPSWIALHPTDRSLLFATNEVTDGKVQLFKVAEDGSLKFLEERSSGGADPASLAVTESQVIVANVSRVYVHWSNSSGSFVHLALVAVSTLEAPFYLFPFPQQLRIYLSRNRARLLLKDLDLTKTGRLHLTLTRSLSIQFGTKSLFPILEPTLFGG